MFSPRLFPFSCTANPQAPQLDFPTPAQRAKDEAADHQDISHKEGPEGFESITEEDKNKLFFVRGGLCEQALQTESAHTTGRAPASAAVV